jgi:flagellar motor switch/type III secretory pathway protein FliN
LQERSLLPVSAACLVANGVREALGAVLGTSLVVRLLEPALPDAAAWSAIARDAQLYCVRGAAADAAFVLRSPDALALAMSAFGEAPGVQRELSAVEQTVLVRALSTAAGALAAVCGREISPLERIDDIRGFVSYFELILERPSRLRLGIALSREPAAPAAATIRLDDLLDVPLEVRAQCAAGAIAADAFLALRAGTELRLQTRVGDLGVLKLGDAVIARGECGALHGRSAIVLR